MDLFRLIPAEGTKHPILISVPHSGTYLPDHVATAMTEAGRALPDTDWFVDQLYDFAPKMGVMMLVANYSRYVVDLNRPLHGDALYHDGRRITGVVPTETFDGQPIYRQAPPTSMEIESRVEKYYRPYHDCIANQLQNLIHSFGRCILLDAHSIRSRVVSIQSKRFPHLILGTADHTSCSVAVEATAMKALEHRDGLDLAVNTPFKGGQITRSFGQPSQNIHALQLEMSQDVYLDESSIQLVPERVASTREILIGLIQNLINITQRI